MITLMENIHEFGVAILIGSAAMTIVRLRVSWLRKTARK